MSNVLYPNTLAIGAGDNQEDIPMKHLKLMGATTALVLAAASGSAMAVVTQDEANKAILDALNGQGNVNVSLDGTVITVAGYANDGDAEAKVLQAARELEGITEVIDLVEQGN